jgi:zinc protease
MKTPSRICSLLLIGTLMMATTLVAQTVDRTKRPAPQKPPTIELPAFQKATLSNGLAVWVVEQHKLPIVAFNLVLQSGAACDPADRPGLATLTAELMDAGTKTMDALQIADRLDFIGANMRVGASYDGSSASLTTLSKHLDEALAVYSEVLTGPTFPQKEFERIKKQRLTSLLQQKDRAAITATIAFNHIVYGGNHPYGNDPSGSEASVSAMTRDDVVKFYETYYRPNNATLIVVGDVTLKDLLPRLEKGFAGWKKMPVPTATIPAAPQPGVRTVYLIDKPGAPQSEIRIGYPCLARSTPDFFSVQLLNRLLGGQYSSRINLNLREKHGYTYGARSTFVFNKEAGPFYASGGFVSTKTDSSIYQLLYEIDRTYKDGVTAEELEFGKKGMIGSFALGFETAMQIAAGLQSIVLYHLPDDYFNTYLQHIDAVALGDVQKVAKKYLDSSKMAIVVVGDVNQIRKSIEALNVGTIVLCDSNGNPLPK